MALEADIDWAVKIMTISLMRSSIVAKHTSRIRCRDPLSGPGKLEDFESDEFSM